MAELLVVAAVVGAIWLASELRRRVLSALGELLILAAALLRVIARAVRWWAGHGRQ
jgi:hypothetical protein